MNYNYVEEKVDTFMIDKLESKYPGVKGKISKASRHSKRMAIASILGNREIFELIKKTLDLQKSDEYLTYLDELVVLFRKYVEVADTEVKTHGEVMTPIWLVEDMLNTLPSEVWSNPNLKWLDPCAGVGTFPSIVVQRLMKGLENVIPNPEKRYGHIVENMIYVCELQEKNLFVFNCVFDLGDNNATNSYCGSFLDDGFDNHMKNIWGVEKFDIVIGNPPYQTQNEGDRKTTPIWHLFVKKSLDILIGGGYLNMVHPSGWRNIEGNFKSIQLLMKSKQILYLEIHSADDGVEVFNAKTRYDFYCLKNVGCVDETKIKGQDGKIFYANLNNLEFIPNAMFDLYKKFIAKDGEEKVEILYNRTSYGGDKKWMSKEMNEEFKYPCAENITTKLQVGKTYYSNTNSNGHFGIPKIIVGRFGINPYLDINGEYGMTNDCMGIVDEVENFDLIKTALLNPEFIEFNKQLNVDGMKDVPLSRKVISTFRKDFWKEFINYGEDYLKSKVENKNILNVYEKLEEKLLSLNEVETDTKKYYKNFSKGNNIFIYCYFLKGHIHINIKRGDIKQDGSKSKGFFTLNDPKNICVEAEYTIKKNGINGKYHRIVIEETTDIDYVYSLILQKYYTL